MRGITSISKKDSVEIRGGVRGDMSAYLNEDRKESEGDMIR